MTYSHLSIRFTLVIFLISIFKFLFVLIFIISQYKPIFYEFQIRLLYKKLTKALIFRLLIIRHNYCQLNYIQVIIIALASTNYFLFSNYFTVYSHFIYYVYDLVDLFHFFDVHFKGKYFFKVYYLRSVSFTKQNLNFLKTLINLDEQTQNSIKFNFFLLSCFTFIIIFL